MAARVHQIVGIDIFQVICAKYAFGLAGGGIKISVGKSDGRTYSRSRGVDGDIRERKVKSQTPTPFVVLFSYAYVLYDNYLLLQGF